MRRQRTLAQQRVYEAVTRALQERGLTHEDVAKKLGKDKQTISNRISLGGFTPAMADRWSRALNIPVSVFLEGDEALRPESGYEALVTDMARMRKEIDELKERLAALESASTPSPK